MKESEIYEQLTSFGFKTPNFCSFKLNDPLPKIDFYPVALKIESPKVVHKSDFGGVILSIPNEMVLKEAIKEIISNVAQKGVELDSSDGFIVTAMTKGVEVYVGVVDDEIFGKVILFGKGGVYLEMYKDVCYIDTKASDEEIIRAIKSTKISKVFDNFRGTKIDIRLGVEFIKKVQLFVEQNPDIIELDFNPVILNQDGFTIVDSRIKKGVPFEQKELPRNRPNFFENQKIAVIGASAEELKVGYAVAKNSLISHCDVYFINQKGGYLFGRELYTKVSHLPTDIDTAVITIPSKFVLEVIEELIQKNIKNLVIISAGFKEVGDLTSEDKIKELANIHNFNIIGPNCLGYFNGNKNLNLTFGTDHVLKGNLALLSQSGAVLSALMDKAYVNNIGFSHIVSVGNMVDLNFAQMIEMLNEDELCQYISIYAEGIKDGKRFLQAIRNSKKPIYIFKTGKNEASKKAAFSHTGNLSGNYDMFKGLIQSVGSKIQDNIEALLFNPLNVVENILIVTNAGGPASILTDYIIDKGKKMYELSDAEIALLDSVLPFNWPKSNPVDIIGDAMCDRYEKTLDIVTKFDKVDMIYVLVTPQFMTDCLAIAELFVKYKNSDKKIIPIFLGGELVKDALTYLRAHKILSFTSTQEASAFL
jgi:acetate---CoA ligase (ADP-forming)